MIHYQDEILQEIALINKAFPNPQCYLVALLLTSKFGGEVHYDSNHCISFIGMCFYDKNGIVLGSEVVSGTTFLPLEEFGMDIKKTLITALIEKHKT